MNSRIIILAVAVLGLASCSTAYRTGQTPDDVYYSPEKQRDEYVVVDRNNDRVYSNDRYYNPDDNYLRMMSRNRYRWSAFDDYYWMDSRRNFGFNSGFGMYSGIGFNPFFNPWSFNGFYPNYWTWNNWYNPYGYNHVVVINPGKNPNMYNRFKTFNAGSYGNQNYSNTNARRYNYSNGKVRPTYNNTNRNNNNNQLGTSIKKVFSNDRDYNSSGDRPVRTYNPNSNNNNSYTPSRSTNNSSSGSSNSGSSGSRPSGSRPGRGN